MRLRQLKLTTFRNIAAAHLVFPPEIPIHALIGPNGSGKTSVLEAISLFTPTRGLLGADGKSQIHHGSKEWTLWAELENSAQLGQTFRGSERLLLIDSHRQPLEKLAELGSIIWLTPATDFLFSGPPASRRRWLDDATSGLFPNHANAVARFRQHRQARLKLLMQGRGGDWLEAEEALTAEWGIHVLHGRQRYLSALQPHLQGLQLTLHGTALEVMADPNPTAALKGKFERSREIDTRMQRTHAGPNTLEVHGILTLEDTTQVPLHQASSGQHKRGLLLWLQAHVALLTQSRKNPPLVLIDEFSAHLDATRRTLLLNTLTQAGCQIILTDTEAPNLTTQVNVILFPLGATH